MDSTLTQTVTKQNSKRLLSTKRPNSLKVELLTTPENSVVENYLCESDKKINVGFRNVSFYAKQGFFRRQRVQILRQVSGEFPGGHLTAIMGPSGSGKTTLMNIIAGYRVHGVFGELTVNGEARDENVFREKSCYITQDDNLQPLLTVQEAMIIAANLKLSSSISNKDKVSRVKEILEAIGLWDSRKVKTQSLSGGQRKRLAIALELLTNPQIMFFDEPTSGLDSVTSKQCVLLLKQLAEEGKTIICTIHQPSASLFEMFDHLYVLTNGQCMYHGAIKNLLPYLEENDLKCPPYHNPADYLLEVATGEHGPHAEALVKKCDNGRLTDCSNEFLQLQCINGVGTNENEPKKDPFSFPLFRRSLSNQPNRRKFKYVRDHFPTSFLRQLYILLKRTFIILGRDPTLMYSRLLTHVLIAIFLGILCFGIGSDAKNILDNSNFLFFSVMFLMLTAFNCITTTFPSELPVITKECFNRWYSVKSYFLAITIADIPVQIVATVLFAVITFFMTAQPMEFFRFLLFTIMCILISLVSQSFGLVIGASMDVKNGVIFGPFCLLPFTIFSGFFVQMYDAHPYMRWLFHISFLKYGYEGLMLSVFGYDRGKIPCSVDYCHFVYPEKFLDVMDMEDAVYRHCVYFMVGLIILIRCFSYCLLYLRLKWNR